MNTTKADALCSERFDVLTLREREVIACLMGGWTKRAVAKHLDRSVKTIENHTAKAFERMGVHSIVECCALEIDHLRARCTSTEAK